MQSARRVLAHGANYEIIVKGRLAFVRIWSRPDLSFESGAALAEEVLAHVVALAKRNPPEVTGLLADARETKALVGKRTRAVVAEITAACEEGGIRLALLASSAVTRALLEAAMGSDVRRSAVFEREDQALAWIGNA